ncbi:trypsin-like isoform X1 [Athalia rosae]|uniref:trypsin-like isoform X1 n=1 Tax=Athalia rosae TaxID=37344 RepID=UPI0020334297|nr:trypsin-like isoform X1 [Athalia rosae]
MNSNNLNNSSEHSYLCLVAIYAIHVIVMNVYSPSPDARFTNVTTSLPSAQLDPRPPMANRWKIHSTVEITGENFTYLFHNHTGYANGAVESPATGAPLSKNNTDYPSGVNDTENGGGTLSGSRIIGGSNANIGQFPHQVSLRRTSNGVHFCGGSIVDEEWIVTAAHCMYSDGRRIGASTITIYAGDLLLDTVSSTSQRRIVKSIFVHENFNLSTLRNDIALLKLRSKLILDDKIVAAKTLRNYTVEDGTICQVSGWGVTRYANSVLSNKLLYVDVPIVNRTLCQRLMISYSDIPELMICAGYLEGGYDACQGDSGGGMICDDVLAGVVSWGNECALANYPGVYTNVYVYKDWVLETIATNASSPISHKGSSAAVWGVFFGCLVFLFTYTDREKFDSEVM